MKAYLNTDIYNKEAENWENLTTAPPRTGWKAQIASTHYGVLIYVWYRAFRTLPWFLRGYHLTDTGRTLAAPSCGICTGDHPNAVASNDSTPMTYLYQLMHIRNWGNANLHLT